MFEINETDKGIELYFSNSEEHTRTGAKLTSFTHSFTFDGWMEFAKAVMALNNKMYPEPEMEPIFPIPQPLEPEEVPAFKGRAEEIMYCLREFGPLTYKELADKMDVTYQRVVRLVSQMIRDGIKLKREGKPRKVSLG